MATLQAIAHGLAVAEGDGVGAQLMKLYQAKIERTLMGAAFCAAIGSGVVMFWHVVTERTHDTSRGNPHSH